MSEGDVRMFTSAMAYVAQLQAAVARVEGMKAANEAQKAAGLPQSFDSRNFFEEAQNMESYADSFREF